MIRHGVYRQTSAPKGQTPLVKTSGIIIGRNPGSCEVPAFHLHMSTWSLGEQTHAGTYIVDNLSYLQQKCRSAFPAFWQARSLEWQPRLWIQVPRSSVRRHTRMGSENCLFIFEEMYSGQERPCVHNNTHADSVWSNSFSWVLSAKRSV